MIEFISKNDFIIENPVKYKAWIKKIIQSENKELGEIIYTFCDDKFLDELNQQYLNHTDFTDIISFDSTIGNIISGEIFISIERVKENAIKYKVDFQEELLRVMAHGILHYCGYKDFTEEEIAEMREKENEKTKLFHVEQF